MPSSRRHGVNPDRQLRELQRRARELGRKDKVSWADLFTTDFLRHHTRFQSLRDMQAKAEAHDFRFATQEDIDNIPGPEWESFVRRHTDFRSFQEMLNSAGTEYAARELGLGR